MLETSNNRCLTVGRQSRDHRPLSRDPSVSFYKKFPNCLKRRKTLFDSQPTVAWPPTTVAWPFSDFFKIFPNRLKRPKNVVCQSADGRVTSTTVAWPFSDFFQNFPKSLETSKKRCLTVGRRSRNLNHCRVTVQRLFSKFSQIAWNVQKTLFDSRPTVAWPPTTVAWPFSDFSQNFPKSLETSKKRCLTVGRWSCDFRPLSRDRSATFFKKLSNCLKRRKIVVRQSADSRVTTDYCRVTLRWVFTKSFLIAWNVEKRCLTVSRRSRDLRPLSRDRSATFFKFFSNCLKRLKNVVWQSADGRVTLTTVAWPFSDFFQNLPKSLETSRKRCLTVGRRSRDLRPLSRDRSATFFQNFPKSLETSKTLCLTVGRWSRDLRPLSRDRSATFFKKTF